MSVRLDQARGHLRDRLGRKAAIAVEDLIHAMIENQLPHDAPGVLLSTEPLEPLVGVVSPAEASKAVFVAPEAATVSSRTTEMRADGHTWACDEHHRNQPSRVWCQCDTIRRLNIELQRFGRSS